MRQRLSVVAFVLAVVALLVVASSAPPARLTSRVPDQPSVFDPGAEGTDARVTPSDGGSEASSDERAAATKALDKAKRTAALRMSEKSYGFDAASRREPRRAWGRIAPVALDDSLLVTYRPGTTGAERADVLADAGAKSVRYISDIDVEIVSVATGERDTVRAKLASDERVERVDLNHEGTYFEIPNDEYLGTQVFTSRLPAAWDVTHGGSDVGIAVIDTGVDLDHPDLAGRIGTGHNAIDPSAPPTDDVGHGTMVAGVAAANPNNGIGVAGAAWNATIYPVKVGNAAGLDEGHIIAGVMWAANNPNVHVINMSVGTYVFSQPMADAIATAIANGKVVVAAAGNEATDQTSYPAAFPGVIGVGATDELGDLVWFSNHASYIDVVAQGWLVITTCNSPAAPGTPACSSPEGLYEIADGTSFSSPLVAGVAAMVIDKLGPMTPAQMEQRLRSTAIDRGPRGIDDYYGAGLVDAYAAVGGKTAASPPPADRDAKEPDDTAVRAQSLTGTQTGTISPEGDVDWVYVDATGAGTITLTVTPPAADDGTWPQTFMPRVGAYSPDLDRIGLAAGINGGQALTFTQNVSVAGRYRFRIDNNNASRSFGSPAEPEPYTVTRSFSAAAVTHTAGPKVWVSDAIPAPFAEGLATSTQPKVIFARDLTAASVTTTSVQLIDASNGSAVAATPTYDAATKTVTIAPSAALHAGRPYVIRVTGVTDANGPMSEVFESRFTTIAPATVPETRSDFNGDGFEDVATGAPGEALGSRSSAGAVHVLYGGGNGARTTGDQLWTQDSSGIPGSAETGDRFGDKLATGDLNNDGYDDLIISAPLEDTSAKDAGVVHVIRGSASGLRSTGAQVWSQESSGVPGGSESGDRFGGALASGRFDGSNGYDVAIGSPGEGIGAEDGAGAVYVMRGSSNGLTATGVQLWTQDSAGIGLGAFTDEGFGAAIAAGDMQGDGNDDLVIGTPNDNVIEGAEGSIMILRGSVVGTRPVFPWADFFASEDGPVTGEAYGTSVAVGDLGGLGPADRYADIAAGIPGQLVGSKAKAGAVDVIYNDHSDLFLTFDAITQSRGGADAEEANARFGTALSARPFKDRGLLAVGSGFDDVNGKVDAGSTLVLRTGTAPDFGLFVLSSAKKYTQDTTGVPGGAETSDRFGGTVDLLDIDKDGDADLVVGAPFEGIGSATLAGALYVITDAVGSPVAKLFSQNTSGILGTAEKNDRFGASLP